MTTDRRARKVAKRQHYWKCVAPEGGYYRWVCRNIGCHISVPYPSEEDKFPKTPCEGKAEKVRRA